MRKHEVHGSTNRGRLSAARLPQTWVEVLDSLRTDELPAGEALPFDLSPIQAAAVAQVSDARGWEAPSAGQSRREPLEVTAQRWNIPRERVRQLGLRALQQWTTHAHLGGLHHPHQEGDLGQGGRVRERVTFKPIAFTVSGRGPSPCRLQRGPGREIASHSGGPMI